jgi:starch synthase (maltosyl-transferring)
VNATSEAAAGDAPTVTAGELDDAAPTITTVTSEAGVAAEDWAERVGQIPVLSVGPVVDGGRWPAKAVVGEQVPVTATVFREGHDAVAATAVLIDPDGAEHSRVRMHLIAPGIDRYRGIVIPDREGRWTFRVEGWGDPYSTWEHDAAIKIAAGVDSISCSRARLLGALGTGDYTGTDAARSGRRHHCATPPGRRPAAAGTSPPSITMARTPCAT